MQVCKLIKGCDTATWPATAADAALKVTFSAVEQTWNE
jgi:hypothetical protein